MTAANPLAYRDKMRRRRVKRNAEVLAGSRLSPRAARVQMVAPLPEFFPSAEVGVGNWLDYVQPWSCRD